MSNVSEDSKQHSRNENQSFDDIEKRSLLANPFIGKGEGETQEHHMDST